MTKEAGIVINDGEMNVEELTRYVHDPDWSPAVVRDKAEQDKTLADYYERALFEFSKMVCLAIPKSFLGNNAVETERLSTDAGIRALDECLKKLRHEMAGGKEVFVGQDDDNHTTLASWYTESFIDFMHTMSVKIPDKFKDAGKKKSNLAAIKAVLAIQKRLKNNEKV